MQNLRLFCAVARNRSFSQAAADHGITQSAVSQRIGQLEKHLGIKLIDRSVRPLVLTAAGTAYWHGCRELLQQYDRLEQRISRFGPSTPGIVRVDAIYSAGIDLLHHVKESFRAIYPAVGVKIEYKHPNEVYEAVQEGHCDLGILSYPQKWQRVQVMPLRDESMAVVCSPRHPLSNLQTIDASQLGRWSMVTVDQSLPVGRHIGRYLRQHGVHPNITSEFDNFDTMKSAVAVTEQIAILPKRTVRREAASGVLVVLELEPSLARPMGVIYRWPGGRHDLQPAVQAFLDCLQQHAGPEEAEVVPPAGTGQFVEI